MTMDAEARAVLAQLVIALAPLINPTIVSTNIVANVTPITLDQMKAVLAALKATTAALAATAPT